MITTLLVDEKLVAEARVVAAIKGTNLNQLVHDYLATIIHQQKAGASFAEFTALSGQGKAHTWTFNRDELHERT
ncbi:hypothetical protein [Thiothrix eikelboomii]|uniref:hypothetical protein n=1 Tax=Thiothrix eikelboomii TaxID=92487 RepID=UPI003BAE2290